MMVKKICASTDIWNGSLGFFSNFAFEEEKMGWVTGKMQSSTGQWFCQGFLVAAKALVPSLRGFIHSAGTQR